MNCTEVFLEMRRLLERIGSASNNWASEVTNSIVHQPNMSCEPVPESENGAALAALGVALPLVYGAEMLGGVALLAEFLSALDARVRFQLQMHAGDVLLQVGLGTEGEFARFASVLAWTWLACAAPMRSRVRPL